MQSAVFLDRAGRRRSPATVPGFHYGRPPRNKGLLYPPTVEEIIAVMRELYLCEWHLRQALERPCQWASSAASGLITGTDRRATAERRGRVHRSCVLGSIPLARTRGRYPASGRVAEHDRAGSSRSSSGGGLRWKRLADMPLSISPLDAFINPIRASIKPGAYVLKNRERTNPLLALMQLHANGQDDVHAYT